MQLVVKVNFPIQRYVVRKIRGIVNSVFRCGSLKVGSIDYVVDTHGGNGNHIEVF